MVRKTRKSLSFSGIGVKREDELIVSFQLLRFTEREVK
jgi:hypothetical protein